MRLMSQNRSISVEMLRGAILLPLRSRSDVEQALKLADKRSEPIRGLDTKRASDVKPVRDHGRER
jgi:hypothetical protein